MPLVPTGNTNAPSIMIGERAAALLVNEAATVTDEAATVPSGAVTV